MLVEEYPDKISWSHHYIRGAWKDFAILASLSATPFHLRLTWENEVDSKYNAMHCESSMIWPKGARHGGSIFMDFTTFSEPLSRIWFRVPWQKTPLFDTPKLQQRLQCVAEVFFLITDQLPYPIRLVSPRRFLLFESCGIWHYQNLLWGWDFEEVSNGSAVVVRPKWLEGPGQIGILGVFLVCLGIQLTGVSGWCSFLPHCNCTKCSRRRRQNVQLGCVLYNLTHLSINPWNPQNETLADSWNTALPTRFL